MPHHSILFTLPWIIPFTGIILSLAVMPLVVPNLWHTHHKKILAGWITGFLAVLLWTQGATPSMGLIIFAIIHHYLPFMAFITVLFTVGGGIHIKMKGKASPLINTGLLATGALLANVIGTTGASMLLIRPVIALNRYRRHITHVVIFFIFLVSNIGGILTPLGVPPLFIGFLNGIDFFWTTSHLFIPFIIVGGALLIIFWIVDHYHFYHDSSIPDPEHMHGEAKIKVKGKRNIILLGICLIVIFTQSWVKPNITNIVLGVTVEWDSLCRDMFLFIMAYTSWKSTPSSIHEANHFTWVPLKEVALVFLGIFITIIPVLDLLQAGESGPLKALHTFVNPHGIPSSYLYFWLVGIFSSILDNAPTYMIFFNMGGGKPEFLMNGGAQILAAISTGAVFMGAMTYIGNAPNFMVRSIALQAHLKMPGFLGYMIWSFSILVPVFLIFSWYWFF